MRAFLYVKSTTVEINNSAEGEDLHLATQEKSYSWYFSARSQYTLAPVDVARVINLY